MRTLHFVTGLLMTTALLNVHSAAQAGFAFVAPAKAPVAPTAVSPSAPAAKPVSSNPIPLKAVPAMAPAKTADDVIEAPARMAAPVSAAKPVTAPTAPAMVPVTRTDAPQVNISDMAKPVPVWSAKPQQATVDIPLTPIVSASDSLEIIDAPLLPELALRPHTQAAAPLATSAAAPRQMLATQSASTRPMTTAKPMSASDAPAKPVDVVWDKPASAVATPVVAPAPIVETILEPAPAPAPAAPAPVVIADDKVVEGFGSGIPMAMALRQIVPPQYRFSFGPGIDPGQRVSWQGGRKWSEIVSDMAQKQNLETEIAGNVIAIRKSGMAPVLNSVSNLSGSAAPGAAPRAVANRSIMEDVVLGSSVLDTPAAKPAVDETHVSSAALPPPAPLAKPVAMPLPTMDMTSSDKPGDAPLSLLSNDTSKPAPIAATDKMPVMDKTISVSKQTVTQETTIAAPTPLAKPLSPAMPTPLAPPIEDEMIVKPASSLPLPNETGVKVSVDSVASKAPADLNASQEWIARNGDTLRTVLQNWSQQANVSLVWASDFDYPLQTDIRIQGTYPEAVRTVLAGFSKANPKPVGRLHKNSGVGAQPVLLVDTARLIK